MNSDSAGVRRGRESPRRGLLLSLAIVSLLAFGCAKRCAPCAPPPTVCHQYQMRGFDWSGIRRILLVPLGNESIYPHATFEIQEALAARLQCAGRFEVVLARPDTPACRDAVRASGRFDEAELIALADQHNADAIVFGTITQYQPYAPPRVGLSLRLISPGDGVLIASVDGLWDARDQAVAEQARCYTGLTLDEGQSLLAADLTSGTPSVFRRFACHYAVEALVNPVQYPETTVMPVEGTSPGASVSTAPTTPQSLPNGMPFPPPVPPVPPDASGPEPMATPILPALPAVPPIAPEPDPSVGPALYDATGF